MIAIPNVTKNPQTQPRTLHDQAKARIAKQTYSPNNNNAAFCQLNVRYLISWSASSIRNFVILSRGISPASTLSRGVFSTGLSLPVRARFLVGYVSVLRGSGLGLGLLTICMKMVQNLSEGTRKRSTWQVTSFIRPFPSVCITRTFYLIIPDKLSMVSPLHRIATGYVTVHRRQ